MILFRAVYLRDRLPRAITFPALNGQVAERFAQEWIERARRFWKDTQLIQVLPYQKGLAAREEALEARQKILLL